MCVCVTEGAGPLLWLCVLPSGARQIFEERILPEGQCHTAGGLNTAGDRKLKHEQGSSTQCTVFKKFERDYASCYHNRTFFPIF